MSETRDAATDQVLPAVGCEPVSPHSKAKLDERINLGVRKYGRPLETWNGRDPLRDGEEEMADGLHYATQARVQRDETVRFVDDLVVEVVAGVPKEYVIAALEDVRDMLVGKPPTRTRRKG